MHIALKCPAPLGPNLTKWGDYPFAHALARALEARGAQVSIHFWPEWDTSEGEDAILVLRGKRRYAPPPGVLSAMWVMSHPATVSAREIDAYDHVYVASETHARLLAGATSTPVAVMRQCTDPGLFAPSAREDSADRRDIIFVANSRGVRRDIVQLAAASGAAFKIIGRHWRNTGLGDLVTQDFIDNDDLPALYRASRLSLNDHWGDMAHFGYINNRIFDCLSCGLPVLTDVFPELREVCGEGLLYASDAASFDSSMQKYLLAYPDVVGAARELWGTLRDAYTFDRRAEQILEGFNAPHRAAKSSRAGAEERSEADAVVDALARVSATAKPSAPLQLLHVHPSAAATYALSARDDASYLSAGLGLGPWHVALPLDAAPLIEATFDAVFIEQDGPGAPLSPAEQGAFFGALVRRARPGAAIAVPTTYAASAPSGAKAKADANIPVAWRLFVRA